MKITIAIDSFKGSMTSMEAGEAAKKGMKRVFPDAEIIVRPLADGGEGTVEALALGCGGMIRRIRVTGPLGTPVVCEYGIIKETKTAIIEMAGAAGITLVDTGDRNPLHTTTYGVGEVIKDAVLQGCHTLLIGIGGSATNDGGIGMLQALGYGCLDSKGQQVCFGAEGLKDLVCITDENVLPQLEECTFRIACDVTNPLCGEQGCSAVYGPQKGATEEMIVRMDHWLERYADIAKGAYEKADPNYPGAGAAGGMGFAFMTFFHAVLEPGIEIVLRETHLKDYVKDADLVVTGEGCLDGQTVMGKAPVGVAGIAKEFHKPVIAFSGCAGKDAAVCNQKGIDAFFPILRTVVSLEEAMKKENAVSNMADTVEQAARLIRIFYLRQ